MKDIIKSIANTLEYYNLKYIEALMDGDLELAEEINEEIYDFKRTAKDTILELKKLSTKTKVNG